MQSDLFRSIEAPIVADLVSWLQVIAGTSLLAGCVYVVFVLRHSHFSFGAVSLCLTLDGCHMSTCPAMGFKEGALEQLVIGMHKNGMYEALEGFVHVADLKATVAVILAVAIRIHASR